MRLDDCSRAHGNPLEGYTVTAWDEDPEAKRSMVYESGEASPVPGALESAKFMGSTLTDNNGEYRIHYAANQWYQA